MAFEELLTAHSAKYVVQKDLNAFAVRISHPWLSCLRCLSSSNPAGHAGLQRKVLSGGARVGFDVVALGGTAARGPLARKGSKSRARTGASAGQVLQ